MKVFVFLVIVALLSPLWIPMLIVIMAWDMARAVDTMISGWLA